VTTTTKATTMRERPLGRSGLTVSELSLGTWAFGGDEWGPPRDAEAIATIRAAVDAGVTLVDTADVYGYGHAEDVVRRALAGTSQEVLVCSKAGNDVLDTPRQAGGGPKRFDADYLRRALEGTLTRLAREAVDIYLLHNPSLDVLERDEAMAALREARQAGRARLVGASVYTAVEGRAAIDVGGADVVMITCNAVNHAEASALAAHAGPRGVAVLARSPLASGLLTGAYGADAVFAADDHRAARGSDWLRTGAAAAQRMAPLAPPLGCDVAALALAFVLSSPDLASVVVGARTPAQLHRNLAAGAFAPLDERTLAAVRALAEA